MENNLIELAHTYFDEESYMQLASQEKLNVEQVKRGMQTIIPSLYLGLERKSGADLRQLLDRLHAEFAKIDTTQGLRFPELPDSEEEEEEETNRSTLEFWFDDAYDETLKNTRNFLELDTSSALKVFSSAIPAVVAALTGNGDHWDVTTIQANLNNNRDNFLTAIPSGLPLNILFDGDKIPAEKELPETTKSDIPKEARQIDPVRDVVFADPIIPRSDADKKEGSSEEMSESDHGRGAGWWWIIVPILLLLLWFLFGRGCSRAERPESDAARIDSLITDSVVEKPSSEMNDERVNQQIIDLPLKDDTVLQALSGGIEEELIQFLDSGYQSLSDEELAQRWFDFDNLNFEVGTATILSDSYTQVANLAAILNAYPDVKIKVGGYTDKTGDEEQNLKISNDRAIAVKNALDEHGVGNQVMATEGYGSEFAQFEAEAPEADRMKDRRVAVSVRKQ